MLYVQVKSHGSACHAQSEYPGNEEMRATDAVNGYHYETRNEWKTFERAEVVAQQLGDATGKAYVATDSGEGCYPRFDVIRCPQIGDPVSYGFNGDYYPCGYITNVSKSLRVIKTDTGRTFYRRRLTGTWLNHSTWALCAGHIDERNPSF